MADWSDLLGLNAPIPDQLRQRMTQPPQYTPWAQAHPTAAQFMLQALKYGPMAMRPGGVQPGNATVGTMPQIPEEAQWSAAQPVYHGRLSGAVNGNNTLPPEGYAQALAAQRANAAAAARRLELSPVEGNKPEGTPTLEQLIADLRAHAARASMWDPTGDNK